MLLGLFELLLLVAVVQDGCCADCLCDYWVENYVRILEATFSDTSSENKKCRTNACVDHSTAEYVDSCTVT